MAIAPKRENLGDLSSGDARIGKGDMVTPSVPMLRSADLDEMVGPELGLRLAAELGAALRRRPAHEPSLAGLLRSVVGRCERLRDASAAAVDVLVRRQALDRPLYGALLRALVEARDARVTVPLVQALRLDNGGGFVTIAAAALSDDPALAEPLAQLALTRSPHIAFGANVALAARGESDGKMLDTIAPRIKESHRIELAELVVLPLVRSRRPVPGATHALEILRDSERHLGRWLGLAELTQLAGSTTALVQARRAATTGPAAARSAWDLAAWALQPELQRATKPTFEVVARLSDRPSLEKDLSFLFRMAEARVLATKAMLESIASCVPLTTAVAVRAAAYLVRDHGREDLLALLVQTAMSPKREPLRGLALAAIADCYRARVTDVVADLFRSRHHATVGFAALVRIAVLCNDVRPIITEANYRHLQLGWLD